MPSKAPLSSTLPKRHMMIMAYRIVGVGINNATAIIQ